MRAFLTEFVPAFIVCLIVLIAAVALNLGTLIAFALAGIASVATLTLIEKVKG